MSDRIDLTSNIKLAGVKDLPYGEIEVIVSSSALDRHGETIQVQGINTKEYMQNPTVLWAHNYEDLAIGKVTKLWKSSGKLMARIKFATEIVPFAKTVYDLVREGYLNAVSIGGLVREYAETKGQVDYSNIAKMDMVELSVVPVGANPEALVTSKALEAGIELGDDYTDFVAKASHKDLDTIINTHIESTKSLLSALENITKDASSDAVADTPKKVKHIRKYVLSEQRKIARSIKTQSERIASIASEELRKAHNE